ncbi:MAG: aminotransferase class III-fold pyridoxal phosphate-dependent enzyme [Gammaproteobacteria bacterium]|nr:aminotransferase class III-fold pyridoxal phosphate-dependent enzyme [Gammaproteobacteria bacterium]MBT8111692.1 aminotransferase class III-fold pyridoxal phosphate-dependent enzyme [Gammaproteobacteria bacterium]NND46854.1 aminotransferase class III-fold pyridoxal phosphate-dependent enzyme [Woeseiaceae bacterium]NNL46390.1 aminotransferase class III-fold pyridoxal phosphate-dependent enzyme [Woeseiaceae bacterium]
MRDFGGSALTTGVGDDVIAEFLGSHRQLSIAIERGHSCFLELQKSHPDYLALNEADQIAQAHAGLTNFYAEDTVNPYVPAGAAGPWVVSLKGAVVYDCGGYGMLGLGHAPAAVLDAMNQPHVMANIMTASVNQVDFVKKLRQEIGHTRKGGTPFASFLCLNSGSESMSIASRIGDINTKMLTDPGARYEDCEIRGLTLQSSFHGRTDRPARFSHSTSKKYKKHLASYRDRDYLLTVAPNDIAALESMYSNASKEGVFIEAFFMEPVMGEGNPGMAIEPAFYQRARELTREHGSMLVVDSIQAGLRAHGVLSVVDYPGFQKLDEPDMESYSKAVNAGQYPLSVLALSERAAATYRTGLYGNTMSTNPRALDVAMAVLDSLNPELRENIRTRGRELVTRLGALADETDGAITRAQGTGLLLSCELDSRYKVSGANSTEEYLRKKGLGVIHGGEHSLRYTPVFDMGSREVDLIVELTRDALLNGPVQSGKQSTTE